MNIDGAHGTIPHEKMIVTLSSGGFIKRIPSTVYNMQHRRGKGVKGMGIREADAVKLLVMADTRDNLVFFTNTGKVFHLKCHEIPADAARIAKGLALVKLIPITEVGKVTAAVSLTDFKSNFYILMATEKGEIKKSSMEFFKAISNSGIIAMDIEQGDELVAAGLASDEDDAIIVTQQGKSIRFKVKSLIIDGVISGIRLEEGDKLVSMEVVIPDAYLLVVTANGYGKLNLIADYKNQTRGGVGIKTLKVTEKTGNVTAAKLISQNQQLMLISKDGMAISTPLKDEDDGGISNLGCNTQGVMLMKMDEGDCVVALAAWD
jgi:DNA gyrase subunit A